MRISILLLMLLAAAAAAEAAEGVLIVLNKSDGTANLIDLASGTHLDTLEVGQEPHEGLVSRDGRHLYVTNYSSGTVSVLDLKDGGERRIIETGDPSRPHGLAWYGDTLLVTAEARFALLGFDASEKERIAVETTERIAHMVAAHPSKPLAYVANIGSGTATMFDLEKRELKKTVATGAGAEGIAVSPDGREVWVLNRGADTITIHDAETMKQMAEVECGSFPIRGAFTPDGRYLLASCAKSGEVVVIDAVARTVKKKVKVGEERDGTRETLFRDAFGDSAVPIGVLVHPDGSQAYVACSAIDTVCVIDLETLEITDRFATGRQPDGLAFAPSLTVRDSTANEESEMEQACEKEIVELHRFFEDWYTGRIDDTDAVYARFSDVMAEGFTIVSPEGKLMERDELVTGLRSQHGLSAGKPISIRAGSVQVRRVVGDVIYATYEEWQDRGEGDRGRLSSVMLRRRPELPGGLEWLHVHETWLPD